ncbi:hypothetical protein B0G83_101224 [Paraburkholderia sp. BL21I4N1]|nr:hypothetical protein B0G83_101224 [Paraburkholderia sp. BL21I4N1]
MLRDYYVNTMNRVDSAVGTAHWDNEMESGRTAILEDKDVKLNCLFDSLE